MYYFNQWNGKRTADINKSIFFLLPNAVYYIQIPSDSSTASRREKCAKRSNVSPPKK
jgi:hypothetical protein